MFRVVPWHYHAYFARSIRANTIALEVKILIELHAATTKFTQRDFTLKIPTWKKGIDIER